LENAPIEKLSAMRTSSMRMSTRLPSIPRMLKPAKPKRAGALLTETPGS
jgi:hypothetical protein